MKPKFNHIDSHVFNGRRYRIIWKRPRSEGRCDKCGQPVDCPTDGGCDPPDNFDKCILIAPKLSEPLLLETALHEGLHGLYWWMDEDAIEVGGRDLASFLRRIGFHL